MVSILSGVLSGAWSHVEPSLSDATAASQPVQYDQPTMGHFFAAVRIDTFQPLDCFCNAMDAFADALHAAPTRDPDGTVHYPGELEFSIAVERSKNGIPLDDRLFHELRGLAKQLQLEMPES
jgi:LDH2 family malate/lactate/ureidoglycolate dehydrogenase